MGAEQSGTVVRALELGRRLTGMRVGYLAEFRDGEQVLRAVDGDTTGFAFRVGETSRLESTYCQRVVDGRLDRVVRDTKGHPETAHLKVTAAQDIGAYVGVAVRFPDGRLYGTLCLLDHAPRPELSERDADLLETLGDLLGQHLTSEQRAQRLEAERDELLASVSHDLRTPLMAIRFLGEDLEAPEGIQRQEAGRQIVTESARVLSMVEDLMLVSRHRAGSAFLLSPTLCDLVELTRQAVTTATRAHDHSHEVALDLPSHPVLAPVDHERLLRAMGNLLDNAHKYSPDATTITVGVRDEGATGVLYVRDRGMGLDPDELDLVEQRFWRSPRAVEAGIVGTGLGLTTVQAISDLHEGTLRITSSRDQGSTFELRVPTQPPELR